MNEIERLRMEKEISYLSKKIDQEWESIKADIARKEVLLYKLLHDKQDELNREKSDDHNK